MTRLFCIVLLITSGFQLAAQSNDVPAEIEKLLPAPRGVVDVMELGFPKRFIELSEKFQTAIATNKDWFMNYVKQYASSGAPLPYDKRLGFTESEYKEYLDLGKQAFLQKTKSAVLKTSTKENVFQFDGGNDLADLSRVTVNLTNLTLSTPFGILKNPEPAESKQSGGLGSYSGYRWAIPEGSEGDLERGDITTASFLIGTLKNSGRKFIYYKGGIMKANQPVSNVNVVIYYDNN